MKNQKITSLVLLCVTLVLVSCGGKDEDPIANFNCDMFDPGHSVVMDLEGSDLKCIYGKGVYTDYTDASDVLYEDIQFEFDRQFYVTFSNSILTHDSQGAQVSEHSGFVFEEGMTYESEARTGNATFFSKATLEITKLDKVTGSITGKVTSQMPISWFEGTPTMGSVTYVFKDLILF